MINSGLFSSKSYEWETPWELFGELHREFHFLLDVCATKENAKRPLFITKEMDGLSLHWADPSFMNPPYGREIGKWIAKAYEESLRGNTVVCLLPARTDTRWWHDYCMKGEIRFIKGRVKFGPINKSAPFPSAIVIFRPEKGRGHK